tara:strand:- start:80 stop:709 length:630 start_codon:yes stop_codon:yes gene_type:complete
MARKKITATTDNSEWKAPKKRKPRKPMTDEQKAMASERLAKAREAKLEKNPDYGKSSIHKSLRNLSDDHQLSPIKVKKWIKVQQEYAKSERAAVRQNVKGADAKLSNHEGYIRNMQKYLRDGDWVDMFYGDQQQGKIRNRCIRLAYYWYGPKKGEPKRDVGTFYPDMGCTYTQEMLEEEIGYERSRDANAGERDKGPVARKRRKTSKAS